MRRHLKGPVLVLLALLSAAALSAAVPDKRALDIQAIDEWKTIQSSDLTQDGRWLAYYLAPNDGDSEVVLRAVNDTTEYRYKAGNGRGRLGFSEDGQWLAFLRNPSKAEAEKAKKAKKPVQSSLVLVKVADGKETEFEKVRSFAFSGENGQWIAMAKYGDEKGKDAPKGADLLLRELATESQYVFGHVSEFAFNKSGDWLAMALDAEDQAGNGVWLRDMKTGRLTVLNSDKAFYEGLSWTEEGDGLALLKGKKNDDYENKLYTVLGYTEFKGSGPTEVCFDPAEVKDFPVDFTVSPNRNPQWTDDLSGLSFGIHDAELTDKAKEKRKEEAQKTEESKPEGEDDKAPKKDEDKKSKGKAKAEEGEDDLPDMVIWHWKDPRLQSEQWVQEKRDKDYSFLCFYRLKTKQFFRLADEALRQVTLAPKQRYAVGMDDTPYLPMGNLDGRRYDDYYVIDLATGVRTRVLEKIRWFFGPSPDGTHLFYYASGHFHTLDMRTGKDYNITEDAPVSFVDVEDDHNVVDPPVYPLGWLKDGKGVLLSDGWDLWRVPVHGGKAVNLTVDGRTQQVRYQRRYRLDRDEKGIDFSEPQYFRVYGEWTKKYGIARIDGGRPGAKRLLWDDAYFASLNKAEDAPVYLYTRESVVDFPDIYAAGPDLAQGRRLTEANPQQAETAWCPGYKIVEYVNDRGQKLQGILYLPAGYEEGKKYPTIVYMYEKLSQEANQYPAPRLWVYRHTFWTSNGYAVLNPDITFAINDPGKSSVGCILPCLDAAVATGVVDPDNVGIHGHSWGGYQTAFMVTQSDRFKAAIAGAALTNMISMYSSIYWNSGGGNMAIFESSQGRFKGGYWDNLEAYQRNSPVYHAENVHTPLLILHNDKDGAVDYNQGVEYYNTLRRLGKPVVMLEYKGENHGLRKPENLKDYLMRQKQYFDYFLKGAPAPSWWTEGIDYLDLKDHLKEQVKLNKRPKEEAPEEKVEPEKKQKEIEE